MWVSGSVWPLKMGMDKQGASVPAWDVPYRLLPSNPLARATDLWHVVQVPGEPTAHSTPSYWSATSSQPLARSVPQVGGKKGKTAGRPQHARGLRISHLFKEPDDAASFNSSWKCKQKCIPPGSLCSITWKVHFVFRFLYLPRSPGLL